MSSISTTRDDLLPVDASGFERGTVESGTVRLHYWRRGSGRPLLVLHGVTDWGLDWARFARRVEGQLDCILLDQRGHGLSEKPTRGYGYGDFARDAWAVIQHLGLERPAVLGHSMGGGVALALAAEHPDAIGRLLLVDPAIRIEHQDDAAAGAPARPRLDPAQRRADLIAQQQRGREALREDLRTRAPTWDQGDIDHTVESTLLVSPDVWGSDERWFDPTAQAAQLRRVDCPTLVVRGEPERGAIITDAAAARIRELVPHDLARVATIAGTGHVPQRGAFELFVAVVLPFLTGDTAPLSEGGTPACYLHLLEDDL